VQLTKKMTSESEAKLEGFVQQFSSTNFRRLRRKTGEKFSLKYR